MDWIKIILIIGIVCFIYYAYSLVKAGRGLDVLAGVVVIGILIIVWSFIRFVKNEKIG